MILSTKIKYFLPSFLLGLLTLASSKILWANYLVSFFSDGITSSTSYFIKAPLLLGFLTLCFFMCACCEFVVLPKTPYPKNILFSFLLAFVVLSFWGHIVFLHHFGLTVDLNEAYCFSSSGVPEVSRLTHLHIMKPIAYAFLKLTGFAQGLWRFDPTSFSSGPYVGVGYAFLGFLPDLFYKISLIIYAVIVLLLFLLMIKKSKEWLPCRWPWLTTLFLACFGVLENLIDGGPFSIEFIFPFLLLLLLINLHDPQELPSKKQTVQNYFLFFVVYLWMYSLAKGLAIGSYLFTAASYSFLYLFPLLLFIVWKKRNLLLSLCLLSTLALLFAGSQYDWGASLPQDQKFLTTRILPPQRIWITVFNKDLPLKVIAEDPPLRVYEMSVDKEQSLYDIARRFGLDYRLRYNPFSFMNTASCSLDPKSPGNQSIFLRGYIKLGKGVSPKKVKPIINTYWKIDINKMAGGRYDYAFAISVHKCIKPTKDMLTTFLLQKALGTENFIIIK